MSLTGETTSSRIELLLHLGMYRGDNFLSLMRDLFAQKGEAHAIWSCRSSRLSRGSQKQWAGAATQLPFPVSASARRCAAALIAR